MEDVMNLSWNLLGILVWIIILVLMVFIVRNIRHRRLKMIVMDQKTFTWSNFLIDAVEIVGFLTLVGWMLFMSFIDRTNINNTDLIHNKVEYNSLILTPNPDKSYYVKVDTSKGKNPQVTYEILISGNKVQVNSRDAAISFGAKPLPVSLANYPFNKKDLQKKDVEYQKAYVAILESNYKNTWQNGIFMKANKLEKRSYLIRIPDETFIKGEAEDLNK